MRTFPHQLLKWFCTLLCLGFAFAHSAAAQVVTNPEDTDPGYAARKILAAQSSPATPGSPRPRAAGTVGRPVCFETADTSATGNAILLPRNDDGSFGPVSLGFNFSLFGTIYNQVYINTNGNITFDTSYGEYNASGFPIGVPMIAPFWADVDTRNLSSGRISYALYADRLVVTWNRVAYFTSSGAGPINKKNTFQLTIKANTAATFTGNDVIFAYDDMQWTTGNASGGGGTGFGGTPATVGANKGDNVRFIQTGRFNLNSAQAPNSPNVGDPGGVDFLDGQCLGYQVRGSGNVPPAVAGFPVGNTLTVTQGQTATASFQFSGPETNQTVNVTSNLGGLCNTTATVVGNNTTNPTVNLTVTGAACNLGSHTLTFTALDNGTPLPAQATFTLTVVVVPPPSLVPTLTALNPTSGSAGATITLTGTNLTGATAVSFNGTAAPFSVVNATTITATIPAGATTGNVTVTTPGGTSNGLLFTITFPDLVVSTTTPIPAGIYNSITVTSTGNGTLAGNVTVLGSTTVQSGGTLNDGCAILSGAGSFALAAGGTLGICHAAGIAGSGASGAIQNTGARAFSTDASYLYNGTAAQNTGTGLPSQVRNLSTTNASTVTLTAPTRVTQIVTIGAAGNLALNGNALTLLSNSAGTALVVNSSTGVVSGNTATVQRYIDPSMNPGVGYRHYSPPVANTTVGDLATAGFQPEVSQATVYNTSPTPNLVTPFPTVFGYDQALVNRVNAAPSFDRGFFVPLSLSSPLVAGRGYAVNISATELVDFVGTLNNGDVTVVVARNAPGTLNADDAGWQFLGNPYPAPLNYARVDLADRAGLEAAIYVYSSTSQYAGQYRTYVNGIGNPILPVGQGFFARAAQPGASTVTFRNSQRLTVPNSTAFQRTTADARPQVQLALRGSTGPADAFYAYAEAGATPALDSQYDATKLPNPTGLNLASLAGPDRLAIDGRAAFTAATAIPLAVGVPAAGTYSLSAAALDNLPAGLTAYLYDSQTGQATPLAVGTPYTFSVAASQAAATIVGRFTLQFSPLSPLATTASPSAAVVAIYPNPAHERLTVQVPAGATATRVQAELLNTLGQVVRRQAAALPAAGGTLTLETTGLATGVYVLRLQAGGSTLAQRVVVQ